MITPQYSSTAMMYILSKETTLTSLADLQIGSQLTKDYKILVTSRPVLEGVIETLGLDMKYEGLKGKISIGNPTDTRILSVTVNESGCLSGPGYWGTVWQRLLPNISEILWK